MAIGAALIGSIVAGAGAYSVGFLGLTGLAAGFAAGAVSFGLTLIGGGLSKPKAPSFDFSQNASGFSQTLKQAITSRKVVYGQRRISGPLVFAGATNNNKFLHLVIPMATHEVEAIDTVYFDNTPITNENIASNGLIKFGRYAGKVATTTVQSIDRVSNPQCSVRINGTTYASAASDFISTLEASDDYGTLFTASLEKTYTQTPPGGSQQPKTYYTFKIKAVSSTTTLNVTAQNSTTFITDNQSGSSFVKIKKYLGTATQVADSDLVSEVSDWTTDHKLSGVAYLYVRLQYDRELFPNGIPNISADIKGKKVYDPRDATTKWTPNTALCIRDYLSDDFYGLNADSFDDSFNSAANSCDEFVAVEDVNSTVSTVDEENDWIISTDTRLPFQMGDRVQIASSGSVPSGLSASTDYYVIPYATYNDDKRAGTGPTYRLATSYANALAGTYIDITSAGSGAITVTKKAEPRYTCNGVIDTETTPAQVLSDMVSSMAGRVTYIGGVWRAIAGVWNAPTIGFDPDDLVDSIKAQTKRSRREKYNSVKGVYVSPLNDSQPTDYPVVSKSTFVTEDKSIEVFEDLDLPFTSRASTAQRIALIALQRHRREITCSITTNLSGMRVQAGDVIEFTYERFGWENKTFEVIDWSLSSIDGAMVCQLALQEIDENVFDFTSSVDETNVEPAVTTTLPDVTDIGSVSNLTIESGTDQLFIKKDGTVVTRIKVSFDAADGFVKNYEVQFRTSTQTEWQPSIILPPDKLFAFIWDVNDNDDYDVRVRAVNTFDFPSEWVNEFNHDVIGKTALPSNVSEFSAQQNGNVVLCRWQQITDKDLAGYEVRYIKKQ